MKTKHKMSYRAVALALLALLFSTGCFAAEIENSSAMQSVKAHITIEGSGEISGNLLGREVEIEALSFRETADQKVLSLNETLEINGKTIAAERSLDNWGNSYALFKVSETGQFSYKIEAVVETSIVFPALQEYDLATGISDFPEFSEPTESIESGSEAIRTAALNKFESDSWLNTIVEVTQWTYDSVEYDLDYFPEIHSALETLSTRKGVCDEFSVLSAAMLRAKGIPVRFVTGLSYNPKEEKQWNNHAWLQAYNPNTGWISLDPTFGEAGVVDGTHIVRGFFPDPEQSSVSRAKVVITATVEIDENNLEVEVRSTKPFPEIFSIEADDLVIKASQWHDLEIKAKNNLNGNVVGWFSLALPENFTTGSKRKLVLFKAGEEKLLEWKIRVDRHLGQNQYLDTAYRVIGIGQDLEKKLKVLPAESTVEKAELRLVDLVPIVEGNILIVEITVENIGAESTKAEIALGSYKEEVEIGGFERVVTTITVSNVKNTDYPITVSGPGLSYETAITVHEGTSFVKPAQATDQGIASQLARLIFTVDAAIIVAAALGIAAIAVLLKEVLSK